MLFGPEMSHRPEPVASSSGRGKSKRFCNCGLSTEAERRAKPSQLWSLVVSLSQLGGRLQGCKVRGIKSKPPASEEICGRDRSSPSVLGLRSRGDVSKARRRKLVENAASGASRLALPGPSVRDAKIRGSVGTASNAMLGSSGNERGKRTSRTRARSVLFLGGEARCLPLDFGA